MLESLLAQWEEECWSDYNHEHRNPVTGEWEEDSPEEEERSDSYAKGNA